MALRILAAACVAWWFAPMAVAQAACDEWNTGTFFEKAAASDVTRCLAEFGADLKARDGNGWTPLHVAAAFGETPSVVAALLDAGADPRARDEHGRTPLHMVAWFSKTSAVVAALLDAGADLKARSKDGETPLHMAAWFSRTPSVVAALLDAGADPRAKNAKGKIPWDLIPDASTLKGTDVYWRLNEARFE